MQVLACFLWAVIWFSDLAFHFGLSGAAEDMTGPCQYCLRAWPGLRVLLGRGRSQALWQAACGDRVPLSSAPFFTAPQLPQ